MKDIPVPGNYYKVILSGPEVKAIGFMLPNEKTSMPLTDFSCTVDSVESITGLDFFYQLPDNVETTLEGSVDVSMWEWDGFTPLPKPTTEHNTSVQCNGTTGSDNRCKNMTTNENGYCHLHQDQVKERSEAVQCSAINQDGTRCKRMTKSPNGNCWQHGGD